MVFNGREGRSGVEILILKKDGNLDATFINEVETADTRYGLLGYQHDFTPMFENSEELGRTWELFTLQTDAHLELNDILSKEQERVRIPWSNQICDKL